MTAPQQAGLDCYLLGIMLLACQTDRLALASCLAISQSKHALAVAMGDATLRNIDPPSLTSTPELELEGNRTFVQAISILRYVQKTYRQDSPCRWHIQHWITER